MLDGPGTKLVKIRLIELRGYCCESCKLSEWLGKPIVLELEHKNGNNRDNRQENLSLLCPNCHSQTDTYCRRKDGKARVTDLEIVSAIQTSESLRQALLKVGLEDQGANYKRLHRVMETYKVQPIGEA